MTRRVYIIYTNICLKLDMHNGNVFIEMFTTADCYAFTFITLTIITHMIITCLIMFFYCYLLYYVRALKTQR